MSIEALQKSIIQLKRRIVTGNSELDKRESGMATNLSITLNRSSSRRPRSSYSGVPRTEFLASSP